MPTKGVFFLIKKKRKTKKIYLSDILHDEGAFFDLL